jgi:hypothetical protein
MKNWSKYILVVLLSGIFFWISAGSVFITYHCADCHYKKEVVQHSSCCNEAQQACSHVPSQPCEHCHDKSHSQNPIDGTSHNHKDGHCTYVVKYEMDLQQNISKIVVPPADFFNLSIFANYLIPEKDNETIINYKSFTPPWRPVNDVLSTLCVFII